MWFRSTNVTDGQTDDMQSQYRALHYNSASRGKKNYYETYYIGIPTYDSVLDSSPI